METILVTGGARSGKSLFAESLIEGECTYIATAKAIDTEMTERIQAHQERRGDNYTTIEVYDSLYLDIGSRKYALLDCLTILSSNIMYEETKDLEHIGIDSIKKVVDSVMLEVGKLIRICKANQTRLVMVTNEVGWSLVPMTNIERAYRDIIGMVNAKVANMCDSVYLVVCGQRMRIK